MVAAADAYDCDEMSILTNLSVFFRMYDSKERKRRMVTPRTAALAAPPVSCSAMAVTPATMPPLLLELLLLLLLVVVMARFGSEPIDVMWDSSSWSSF